VDGCYVGRVAVDDPLHTILCRVADESTGVDRARSFDAFRLNGSNEVYGYEECGSGVKLVGKFFGKRFGWDHQRAAWTADREYHCYKQLRRYALVGSPHHVIRPLALEREINCVLVLEYYGGEQLSRAIDSAVYFGEDERLYTRLTALGFYLATQHNRTANGARVDFADDCDYLDAQLAVLRGTGRIGPWDEDEFRWLSALWSMRERMWSDQQVWLHGDATPANFLFGDGMDVAAIDLERMKRGDRMFDVGRVAGELQHAFLLGTGDVGRAEPFIGHFLWEYAGHFPERDAAFASITSRLPFYMALNLLRVARNDYISHEHGGRLVAQAKELLRSP
jgi:Phosphotransferase enzyme family